ncbi:MAG: argininosuccinate lyase [bacterium]
MKLWEKGYKLNKQIESFTVGEDYILDQKLVPFDCLASMAHAKMLGKIGLLKEEEVQKIVCELEKIRELSEQGRFRIKKNQEDCHTAIENYLTRKLGKLGKKIHTARSRNDQVLTALRLFYKDQLKECQKSITLLIRAMRKFMAKYGKIEMPGYTHMRKAMPSSVSLWTWSFIDSMKDNLSLIDLSFKLIDQSPLGSGAGYGIPLEIDREFTAKLLGFKKVQHNPLYVQNSRGKFESTILHALTQITLDLNKIASDLAIFSMPEFGFFELPEEFLTGSSIMPQKKNPDVLELLRARHHEVVSCEFQTKNISSNLISGYNRDLQLTKWPIIRAFEVTLESLSVARLIFSNLKVNEENCKKALTEEVYATNKVYELVKKGMPFREAYQKVAKNLP